MILTNTDTAQASLPIPCILPYNIRDIGNATIPILILCIGGTMKSKNQSPKMVTKRACHFDLVPILCSLQIIFHPIRL